MELIILLGEELLCFLRQTLDDARQKHFFHIGTDLRLIHVRVVLGADDDGVDAFGLAVVAVLHRHLAFGVGTQITHLLPLAAHLA